MRAKDSTRVDTLLPSPLKVLIYTEGDSSAIPFSIYNFLRADSRLDPDLRKNAEAFEDLPMLMTYDVILLASKGRLSWTNQMRENYEAFVRSGKGVLGIYQAASAFDDFPFYESVIGARLSDIQPDTFEVMDLSVNGYHLITEAFPNPWTTGEYSANYELSLAKIIPLVSHNEKPLIWYQNLDFRGDTARSLYVAIGRDPLSYANNPLYQRVIKQGLLWAGYRLANPSPHPPTLEIQKPKAGKVYKNYPKNVRVKLDMEETALSGDIDSLAVFVNDSLYKSLPRTDEFYLFMQEPGLFKLIVRAYTNKGNYISVWSNFGIRDEEGIAVSLRLSHQAEYKKGDSVKLSAMVVLPGDTSANEEPRPLDGKLGLFINGELTASSTKAPFVFDWVIPARGEFLLKATANSGELSGVDSLFVVAIGEELQEPTPREEGIASLSPNPVKDIFLISFEAIAHGYGKLDIINLSGELLKTRTFYKETNPFALEVDISELEPGLYFARISIGDAIFSQKFVKENP